jgi:hypothetical protein
MVSGLPTPVRHLLTVLPQRLAILSTRSLFCAPEHSRNRGEMGYTHRAGTAKFAPDGVQWRHGTAPGGANTSREHDRQWLNRIIW